MHSISCMQLEHSLAQRPPECIEREVCEGRSGLEQHILPGPVVG